MKRKMINRTIFGALLGLSLWAAFTILTSWLRGQWQFPAVSGHLVMVYGSELAAVTAQCAGAMLCGILWCNAALIFQEKDWSIPMQTGVHILVCMVPAVAIAWFLNFMPHNRNGLMQYLRLFGVIYLINWAAQYLHLRKEIKKINMCLNRTMEETEMTSQKKRVRRPMTQAAVLTLCICMPIAGVAAGNSGFFRDIIRGTAVIGSEYEQATGEIGVTAAYSNQKVVVTATFLIPEKVPFRVLEELAVGSCRIVDAKGKTMEEFENSDAVQITDGRAELVLSGEGLTTGDYTLQIDSFTGSAKADQPLPMKGFWKCEFTVE